MITTAKQSSILQGFPKYRSMLAGNTAYSPPAFESIATVAGTGSSGSITFSSIPSTFKHLQIRFRGRQDQSGRSDAAAIWVTVNGDTGSNYAYHYMYGFNSAVTALGAASQTKMITEFALTRGSSTADTFGVGIIDVLDYASTSKYKTFRTLAGEQQNTTDSGICVSAGLWMSTSAITSITITEQTGLGNLITSSTFALYGMKESA